MKGLSNWSGNEIEGNWTGIRTCFVRTEIPKNYKDYPHIYFTFEYVDDMVNGKTKWDFIENIMNTSLQAVTLEAKSDNIHKIPKRVLNHAHIIYRIDMPNKDIELLKNCDNITIDCGMYNTYIVSKHAMQHVDNNVYMHDLPTT